MAISMLEKTLKIGAFLGASWCSFACLLLIASQSSSLEVTWLTFALLVGSLSMGAITFCVFAHDKRQAQRDGWRVQEFSLHMLSLLGGWSGAFLAQRWLRHKSQKLIFQVTAWCGLAIHLIGLLAWWSWR
jgi:uncharacterized membrane protein YsdA (DUF1294 family)